MQGCPPSDAAVHIIPGVLTVLNDSGVELRSTPFEVNTFDILLPPIPDLVVGDITFMGSVLPSKIDNFPLPWLSLPKVVGMVVERPIFTSFAMYSAVLPSRQEAVEKTKLLLTSLEKIESKNEIALVFAAGRCRGVGSRTAARRRDLPSGWNLPEGGAWCVWFPLPIISKRFLFLRKHFSSATGEGKLSC